MLEQKAEDGWRRGIERDVASWWKTLEDRAMQSADPINPQRVFWELSPRLPENCIMTGDSRLGGQLVWSRHQDAARYEGLAVRQPGLARRCYALRHGCEDGVPGTHGDRVHRRRRHADERPERDDHHLEILEGVVEPAFDRDGAEQPGPQSGHLGGAGSARGRQDRNRRRRSRISHITPMPSCLG